MSYGFLSAPKRALSCPRCLWSSHLPHLSEQPGPLPSCPCCTNWEILWTWCEHDIQAIHRQLYHIVLLSFHLEFLERVADPLSEVKPNPTFLCPDLSEISNFDHLFNVKINFQSKKYNFKSSTFLTKEWELLTLICQLQKTASQCLR